MRQRRLMALFALGSVGFSIITVAVYTALLPLHHTTTMSTMSTAAASLTMATTEPPRVDWWLNVTSAEYAFAVGDSCPRECQCEPPAAPPYKLVGILSARVFREDAARWHSRELVQWFQYMKWAGVERMYFYDSYQSPHERMLMAVKPLIDCGWLEYRDWSHRNPYNGERTQMDAYKDVWGTMKTQTRWIIHTDIDEYVVSPFASGPGWLVSLLENLHRVDPKVATVYLRNIGFLGWPNFAEDLMIDRLFNATKGSLTHLIKPINLCEGTKTMSMHHTQVLEGFKQIEPGKPLYMAHYWGQRLQGFVPGDLTPELLERVEPNYDLQPMSKNLKVCRDRCPRSKFHWLDEQFWDMENRFSNAPRDLWINAKRFENHWAKQFGDHPK